MTQFDGSATSQPHSRSTVFVFMRKTNTCTVFLLNESMSLNKARIQLKSKAKHLTLLQIAEIFQLQPKDSCNKVSTQILESLSTIIQRQFSDFAS
jgi:hypothetical protein